MSKHIRKSFLIQIQIVYYWEQMREGLMAHRTAKLDDKPAEMEDNCIFNAICTVIKTSLTEFSILLLELKW